MTKRGHGSADYGPNHLIDEQVFRPTNGAKCRVEM